MHSKINLTLPGTHEDTAAAGRDCAVSDLTDRSSEANWEVFVSVSKDLSGDLWDAQRNLTRTYTPGCHPDSVGHEFCGDEWYPSLSLQAFNADGLEDLVWPSNLITPAPEEGSPTFISNKYLQVTYLADKLPGSWWLHDGTTYIEANGEYPTVNDVKWFRMACVQPEVYPVIQVNRGDFVWANDYFIADSTQTYTVTVTNAGNATLSVTDIQTTETTGSGWLDVSTTTLTIPAGTSNTATFDIIVHPAAGAPIWLQGAVTIISNAHNKPTYPITINTLAAEVITDAKYDTVATSTAWDTKGGRGLGDNVALVVSNYGEIGNSGEAGTSLDFTVAGGDCDTNATWYLYTSSPFYIQKVGSVYDLTTSHYGASNGYQSRADSWDPASGTVMSKGLGSHGGASFDSVYAGKSFNHDTTVAIERTFFAPRNNPGNPSFVVTKTKLYSVGGVARNAITFGNATDWDIPSDSGSANTSAVKLSGPYVYFQGTNHADSARCQSNLERFGAEILAGWYTRAEYAANPLANNTTIVGMKGLNVRDYFDTDSITDEYDAELWWTATGEASYSAEPSLKDQGEFVTFLHNYNLAANDTLTFWTILVTQHTGTINTFDSTVASAKAWYTNLRKVGCCVQMGNLDQSGDHIVGMGDLTVLIDHLFITLAPLVCPDEGNMDLSPDHIVGMGDLTVLIDHLFISLAPLPTCAQLP